MQPIVPVQPPSITPGLPANPPSRGTIRSITITLVGTLLGLWFARILLPITLNLPHQIGIKREYVRYLGTMYTPTLYIQRLEDQQENFRKDHFILFSLDYVRTIPASISHVPTIERIFINNNPIRALPDSITTMTKLRSIYVHNGNLTSLPNNIGNLTNLTELSFVGNRITRLPESIGNLTNLTALNLAYNNLESLPASIVNLTNLQVLDLTGNRLRKFPSALPPNLGVLFIGGNRIPADILSRKEVEIFKDIVF